MMNLHIKMMGGLINRKKAEIVNMHLEDIIKEIMKNLFEKILFILEYTNNYNYNQCVWKNGKRSFGYFGISGNLM